MTVLHLGCGLDYRPGAVNVDRLDLTAVDLQADVLRLPFADNCVSQIETRQLVEHLGYAGTIFALAEWRRVLAPGGTLLVETPDRPAACLAAAEPSVAPHALHWVFGLPLPGYEHRTLFDRDELRAVAEQAGFPQVEVTQLNTTPSTLRLTTCKAEDSLADLRGRLHTAFAAAGIAAPLTAPPHLAYIETVCDRIVAVVEELLPRDVSACLASVLGATTRFDPRMTLAAFQILVARGFVPELAVNSYLALAHALLAERFPARMTAYLRQNPAPPGTQAVRLQRLDNLVSLYLTGRLHPTEAALQPSLDELNGASMDLSSPDLEISFFCAETVANLSRREAARGVRAFAKNAREIAREHLEAAIAYDADNPLPVWNLARLSLAENRRLEALGHYAALLELAPGATGALRAEMDAVTHREPEDWALSLGPVVEPT